jgi:hypothetical protein
MDGQLYILLRYTKVLGKWGGVGWSGVGWSWVELGGVVICMIANREIVKWMIDVLDY